MAEKRCASGRGFVKGKPVESQKTKEVDFERGMESDRVYASLCERECSAAKYPVYKAFPFRAIIPAHAFVLGTMLGPYEIQAAIGAGGMGEVYRARDTRLERTVAIKVVPAAFSHRPDLRKRLEREARTLSSLSHPHICDLYDVGQQDGVDFLVMEYLEGETLAHRLLKGPVATEQLLKY